jgi:hypothetical protein
MGTEKTKIKRRRKGTNSHTKTVGERREEG